MWLEQRPVTPPLQAWAGEGGLASRCLKRAQCLGSLLPPPSWALAAASLSAHSPRNPWGSHSPLHNSLYLPSFLLIPIPFSTLPQVPGAFHPHEGLGLTLPCLWVSCLLPQLPLPPIPKLCCVTSLAVGPWANDSTCVGLVSPSVLRGNNGVLLLELRGLRGLEPWSPGYRSTLALSPLQFLLPAPPPSSLFPKVWSKSHLPLNLAGLDKGCMCEPLPHHP